MGMQHGMKRLSHSVFQHAHGSAPNLYRANLQHDTRKAVSKKLQNDEDIKFIENNPDLRGSPARNLTLPAKGPGSARLNKLPPPAYKLGGYPKARTLHKDPENSSSHVNMWEELESNNT